MWSIWLIIGVAAAAAVGLMVPGIFLGVIVERRRNRKWMRNHGLEQVTTDRGSRHIHLSVNDAVIECPVRRDLRSEYELPRSSTAHTWATISSDDYLQGEMAMIPENGVLEQSVPNRMDCRRIPRFNVPTSSKTTKRQRKLTKILPTHPDLSQFPLDREELTGSANKNFSEPVELPAHVTSPKDNTNNGMHKAIGISPDHPSANKHRRTSHRNPLQNCQNGRNIKTNVRDARLSRKSTHPFLSCAPVVPLPPLPNFNIDQARNTRSKSVASTTSIDTISSSVLGTLVSSHTEIATSKSKTQSQAFKEFDFGLGNSSCHEQISNYQDLDTSHSRQSFKLFPPVMDVAQNLTSGKLAQLESDDSLKTKDATSWNNKSAKQSVSETLGKRRWITQDTELNKHRFSLTDREANRERLDLPQSLNSVDTTSNDGNVFSRPESIANLDSREWSMNTLSSPTKGHRRQNCVRIKNLTPPESNRRTSRQAFMSELREEDIVTETETPAFSVVDVEEGQKVRSARPSIIEITNSPSPMKTGKPYLKQHDSNKSKGSRRNSELFGVFADNTNPCSYVTNLRNEDTANTPTRSHPLESTSPGNIKTNLSPSPAKSSNIKSKTVDVASSPILPSPAYNSSKVTSRASGVKGPRPQPISHRPGRNESTSPLRGKPHRLTRRKTNEADLRRSIMILRSMSCRDDLTTGDSSENSENAGDSLFVPPPSSPSAVNDLRLAPLALRDKRSSTMSANGQRSSLSKRHRNSVAWISNPKTLTIPQYDQSRCNSIVSWYSESSLWEDVSVRTSPDLDMPTSNKTLTFGIKEKLDARKEEEDITEALFLYQPRPKQLGTIGQLVLKPTVNVGTNSD